VRFRLISSAAFVLTVLAGAGLAFAQSLDASEVEGLIQEANKLRRQGLEARAFPLMQKAHRLASTPRTAAQLGLVEFALGYWLPAEQHLTEALAAAGNPWIEQHRGELERALVRVRASIGTVEIAGQPVGAEVRVNDQLVGVLPLPAPVRVGEGPVRIDVSAKGFRTLTQSLTLTKGQRQVVSVRLAAIDAPIPEATAAPRPTFVEARPDEPARSHDSDRTMAWVSGGVAAGALAFAAVETALWKNGQQSFNAHSRLAPDPAGGPAQPVRDCGTREPNRGGEGCRDLYDGYRRARALAFIGYGVAGVLAATSAVLFLLPERSSRAPGATALTCAPTLPSTGVTCRMTF
jgi:hypothetical protein